MKKLILYVGFAVTVTAFFACVAAVNDSVYLFLTYVGIVLGFLGCIWRRDKR